MDIPVLNWSLITSNLLRLIVAAALALPIAWEREVSTRIMGLRTFPLVAVASCGYILMAESLFGSDAGAQARILQGLITGIGFVGAGAILKQRQEAHVRGTATAASIWSTGAVGAAVGFNRYEIAVIVSLINFLMLQLLTPVKESGDCCTKPAIEQVFFGGYNRACLARCVFNRRFVDRFDGEHVEYPRFDSIVGKYICGFKCCRYHQTTGNDGDIAAVA